MPTVRFSLPGPTLGELVHLATSYFMFLELHMRWGQDSKIGWVDRPQGLQLLLKVSCKHLRTLPWTPGSHHCLKQKQWRQQGSSEAKVSQGATVFQVAWQSALKKIPAVWWEGWELQIHPSFQREEKHRHKAQHFFFLYEEIRSGNIIGKNNLQKLDSL